MPSALRIQELATNDRPRERLRQLGAQALSVPELLTLVLGSGGAGHSALAVAHATLAVAGGSLARLATSSPSLMAGVPGLGPARVAALLSAIELGRRAASEGRAEGATFRTPRDVWQAYAARLQDLPAEEFHVGILDGRHRLDRDVLVTRGTLTNSLVHPREVFREAIAERAAAIVLVHNHPSGDPAPSMEDRIVTRQLVEAGKLLEIPVVDHVIVGRGRYVSFSEAGFL